MAELPTPTPPGPILSDRFLSALAYELATTMYDPEIVFKHFGIGSEYFAKYICYHPAFMTFYSEARAVWNSSDNAMHRFTRKAGMLLEEWLLEANRLLHDVNSPASAKVSLAQWLGRVAGAENVHPPVRNAQGDGGVATQTVVINLNHGRHQHPPIVLNNPTPAPVVTDVQVLPEQVTPPPLPYTNPIPEPPPLPVMPPPVMHGSYPQAPVQYPEVRVALPSMPMGPPMPVRQPDSKPAGEFSWPAGPARFPTKPV